MQVGSAQSQTLVASVSISTQLTAVIPTHAAESADSEAPEKAVLISVGRQIDISYTRRILDDSLAKKLDAALEEAGVDLDVEGILSSGQDMSPEATANRIVDFATSFFAAYQQNHSEENETQVSGFAELIRTAVKDGFGEAKEILQGIATLSSSVASDIDETFGLAMLGIDNFVDQHSQSQQEQEGAPSDLLVA